jgi:hypothetical protein
MKTLHIALIYFLFASAVTAEAPKPNLMFLSKIKDGKIDTEVFEQKDIDVLHSALGNDQNGIIGDVNPICVGKVKLVKSLLP